MRHVFVSGVLASVLLAIIEYLAIGVLHRAEIVTSWELTRGLLFAGPIFLIVAIPAILTTCAVVAWQDQPRQLAVLGAIGGGGVAYGISFGRHFAAAGIRALFIVALASVSALVATYVLPRLLRAPRAALWFGALAIALWIGDRSILPRLYPVFHHALCFASIACATVAAAHALPHPRRGVLVASAILGLALVVTPMTARALQRFDNLKLVLVEHAPYLGRGVLFATRIAPPPKDDSSQGALTLESARSLDWTNADIVLLSVDALRADHVGAYGYSRKTPNIDALAAAGVVFDHAYCPTPHTSYSVTSMMTGKYMRPLVQLGLDADSDTLASHLRKYDYKTAAFYPPAVFFIDEERFVALRDRGLDFEYRKVEFADPGLREAQVRSYVDAAPADRPLFLWVHFFEPHEPYVAHPEHPFGDADIDLYDGEIAMADDGIGRIVALVRKKRPSAVFIVTADHGEEFGDHGGRYHGTTVYEEQVHVPLVVVAPTLQAHHVGAPVQTIDLLPTILSAVGIPRPARVRGRDLGPLLRADIPDDAGNAFAETDDYEMIARGGDRLVCERRARACALYNIIADPGERSDRAATNGDTARSLQAAMAAIGRAHGEYEGVRVPDALRRGAQGDVEAAVDVATLLDDANVEIRRRAAAVLFDLSSPDTVPQLQRAREHDEDAIVHKWTALALVRVGAEAVSIAEDIARDGDPILRQHAALAFAERGDVRGVADLIAWLQATPSFRDARAIMTVLGTLKARTAVGVLVAQLGDVRLRPYAVDALAAVGDASARAPLLSAFETERYKSIRVNEAKALVALGAGDSMRAPLARFAGVPDPMEDAIVLARSAGLLVPPKGGARFEPAIASAHATIDVPKGEGSLRIIVLLTRDDDIRVTLGKVDGVLERKLGTARYGDFEGAQAGMTPIMIDSAGGVSAVWLVRTALEIPPPPPHVADDAGAN